MDQERIPDIFQACRRKFFFPPASLNFHDRKDTPFYIECGAVFVNPDLLVDDTQAEYIFSHELGHMEVCPVSIKRTKRYMEVVAEELGIADQRYSVDTEICHLIMNIFADMMVDKDDRVLPLLAHGIECGLEKMEKLETVSANLKGPDSKHPKHPFWLILMQYYISLTKRSYKGVKIPPREMDTGGKIYRIIVSLWPQEIKLRRVTKLLAQQEFMKDYQQTRDFLKALDEALQKGWGQLRVKELMKKTKEDLKREIADSVEPGKKEKLPGNVYVRGCAKRKKDKSFTFGMAKAAGVSFNDYDYLRAVGKKKIAFRVKIMQPSVGKIERGSMETWTPDDDVADLEVEDSMMNNPILLPGISTLKAEKRTGFEQAPTIPPAMIILDTSGSMDRETGLIICYSFLSACEHYRTPASIILFSDTAYYSRGFTTDHEKMARDIFHKYASGGTDTFAAAKLAQSLLKSRGKSLVIFISDLECGNRDRTLNMLREFKQRGHVIVNIVIKGYSSGNINLKGLKSYIIESVNDISGIVVDEVSAST